GRHGASLDRHDTRLPRCATDRGEDWAPPNTRGLLCRHGGVHRRQFRLGILLAQRPRAVHRDPLRARLLRRQLRALQPLAARTVRDASPRHCLRLLYIGWPLRWCRRQFRRRRGCASHGNAWDSYRLYGDRIPARPPPHSLRTRNERTDAAGVSVPRSESLGTAWAGVLRFSPLRDTNRSDCSRRSRSTVWRTWAL